MIKPSDQIEFDKLPSGELRIRVARQKGRQTGEINSFIGLFARSTNKVMSIDEMNDIS